jgi:ubiquitin-conjugating enzyme E2 S
MGIKHILLTVKCLLIVPNPESALNEEAGKMLLERYEDYCSRARLFTDLYAKQARSSRADECSSGAGDQAPLAKRPATDKLLDKKKKDKKKVLKRL